MRITRRLGLGAYFGGLIVLFVLAALAGALYVRVQSDSDARSTGLRSATVAAHSAARLIDDRAVMLEGALANLSSNRSAVRDLLAHPSSCALSFAHIGAFPTGHVDIAHANGQLVCSSLPRAAARGYTGQPWLTSALAKATTLAPERDPLTGQPAAIFTAPFTGGLAAGVINLRAIGPNLVAQFAGSRGVEYVVSAADGRTVLAESGNPGRWVGTRLNSAASFGATSRPDRPGLDGHPRLFAHATVNRLGWRVYAGLERSVAMASAAHLFGHELAVILGALLIVLAAAVMVYRQIARPIAQLASATREDRLAGGIAPETVRGPAEVADLAERFQGLIGRLENELSERRRAERAARAAEKAARASAEAYRMMFENNPEPMWIFDTDTLEIIEVNEAAVEHYGYTREEFASMTIQDLRSPEDAPAMLENLARSPRMEHSGPWRHVRRDGAVIEVEVTSHEVNFTGRPARFVMATDVTDRERLAHQLAQTQRLESLGQLAGGVAHDFNNLLSVILNYALFVKDDIDAAAVDGVEGMAEARDDLDEIERAARRAADLTHQLLAFARREMINPEVISLNDVVAETEQLLRRTLGEHIRLRRVLSDDPWPILADAGQMAQVLINLSVNARDAMPSGGALLIETANIEVDESYASTRPGLVPGRYVRLRVSDTGTGMDATTLEHAFEPFFTTKPKGAGTGLGLATVYGIVTQSGGHAQR